MGRIRALWDLSVGVAGSGRLAISPCLCEAGARQDSMQHLCVHDLLARQDMYGSEEQVCGRQPFVIQALMCSRPSVIPGCGVLMT